ncbi:hypothetical protein MHBO_000213 [Bonamia ostreae]|uniref:Uncharacterized protein n=1 Tax=Bonamia ostreae TaxID=126728 RepID=A0ABV2AFI9_9EUKA
MGNCQNKKLIETKVPNSKMISRKKTVLLPVPKHRKQNLNESNVQTEKQNLKTKKSKKHSNVNGYIEKPNIKNRQMNDILKFQINQQSLLLRKKEDLEKFSKGIYAQKETLEKQVALLEKQFSDLRTAR